MYEIHKINRRIPQVVFNIYEKPYDEPEVLNDDISIHQKHLHSCLLTF